MEQVRLQKYMADSGIASRRKCEEYILNGEVTVNGKITNVLGIKICPEVDEICFRGKKIYPINNFVTTARDQFNRQTVLDLVKGVKERIVPVGRLDMYTSRSTYSNK